MNKILFDLHFLYVFFDDILCHSRTRREQLAYLEMLFARLDKYGLIFNFEKSIFGKKELLFLGHQITPLGYLPSPTKTDAIKQIQPPKTVTELKGFLATINFYRDFIANAMEVQQHLFPLAPGNKAKDKTPVQWNKKALEMFGIAKNQLASAASLAYPIENAHLLLFTDASNTSAGGALQQLVNGKIQPLGFFSQAFTPAERNYSTYDRELTAIYLSVKHFLYMLEGRDFTIFTDHQPLVHAFEQKSEKATPRQARHLDFIGQFSTDIRHVVGVENVVADMLSRINSISSSPTKQNIIDYSELQRQQEIDDEIAELLSDQSKHSLIIKRISMSNSNILIWCDISMPNANPRPIIPKCMRDSIITAVHNISHLGIKATHASVRHRFIWPKLTRKQIAMVVRPCVPCQLSKVNRHTNSPFASYAPPSERFEHLNMDIIGPLPTNNNMRYCLTIIDRFTRWPEVIPMEDMTAPVVAQAIVREWISRFGTPLRITVDQGRQFESSLFHELNTLLGTQHLRTTSYHPQSNGIIERLHRTLKASIMSIDSDTWTTKLPLIMLGLRCAVKPDIGATAAEMVYGKQLRLPGEFFCNTDTILQSDFVQRLRDQMRSLRPTQTAHHNSEPHFVHKDLMSASHVFVRVGRIRTALVQPYEGPYKVLQAGQKVFKIEINKKHVYISVDRLKPAYLCPTDIESETQPASAIINQHLEQPLSPSTSTSTVSDSQSDQPSAVPHTNIEHSPEDARTDIPTSIPTTNTTAGRGIEKTTTTRFGRKTKFPDWFK